MDERHRLVFETHEEDKLSFEEYLAWVVFFEKRPFTRKQFRDCHVFAVEADTHDDRAYRRNSRPQHGLKIVVVRQ